MGPNFDDGEVYLGNSEEETLDPGVPGMVKIPRPPGCNGGVCYCNHYDYCNDRFSKKVFL